MQTPSHSSTPLQRMLWSSETSYVGSSQRYAPSYATTPRYKTTISTVDGFTPLSKPLVMRQSSYNPNWDRKAFDDIICKSSTDIAKMSIKAGNDVTDADLKLCHLQEDLAGLQTKRDTLDIKRHHLLVELADVEAELEETGCSIDTCLDRIGFTEKYKEAAVEKQNICQFALNPTKDHPYATKTIGEIRFEEKLTSKKYAKALPPGEALGRLFKLINMGYEHCLIEKVQRKKVKTRHATGDEYTDQLIALLEVPDDNDEDAKLAEQKLHYMEQLEKLENIENEEINEEEARIMAEALKKHRSAKKAAREG